MKFSHAEKGHLDIYTPNGVYVTSLNHRLVQQQGLDSLTIDLLKETHVMKYLLFHACRKTEEREQLKKFAKMLETLEYYQQELWGFERNSAYHYWFDIPQCTCEKQQVNETNLYSITSTREYDINCPVHGDTHTTH